MLVGWLVDWFRRRSKSRIDREDAGFELIDGIYLKWMEIRTTKSQKSNKKVQSVWVL